MQFDLGSYWTLRSLLAVAPMVSCPRRIRVSELVENASTTCVVHAIPPIHTVDWLPVEDRHGNPIAAGADDPLDDAISSGCHGTKLVVRPTDDWVTCDDYRARLIQVCRLTINTSAL